MTRPESEPHPPALRGVRPDAETADRLYLITNTPCLRATAQVRLLAALATLKGKELVILAPRECRFDADLDGLLETAPGAIRREDL